MFAEWNLLVSIILFVATFIRSAFGFGEALVAVPLLALLMPIETATPIAVLVSITIAFIVVVQDFGEVHVASASKLFASTLFGTPLGLLMLTKVPEQIVKGVLAIVIVLFSAYSLFAKKRLKLQGTGMIWPFGFLAGVLGGAYGMNGPPLVIYGTLRGWSPQRFRATLQGYFLPAGIVGMFGYWLAGLWSPVVTQHFIQSLPFVFVATFLGRLVNRRMSGPSFLRYVHSGLIVVGAVLFFS